MDTHGEDALQQFVLLSKSTSGLGITALIKQVRTPLRRRRSRTAPSPSPPQVLSSKKIYTFGELLAQKSVAALATSGDAEQRRHHELLALFAYGTYADYVAKQGELPALTAAQTEKLRQLSVVSLAHEEKRVPYARLQSALGLSEVRELEDLIIDTVYLGLVDGTLNQQEAVFKVKTAASRDVRLADIDGMVGTLQDWAGAADEMLSALEAGKVAGADRRAAAAHASDQALRLAEDVKADIQASAGAATGKARGGAGEELMDVDRTRRARGKRQKN